MKILFLDDNPARRRWAQTELGPGNDLTTAETADEAIEALRANEFDVVYLDHDLGEETFVDSSRADCGMEVVRWVVVDRPSVGAFVVHTMNTPAGHAMVRALKLNGYDARYRSFYKLAHGEAC